MRLRLTLSAAGEVVCESTPLKVKSQAMKLVLSQNPLDLSVQETRHKVTARDFYDGERGRIQALCSVDEVLFFNPEGRLCEGSFTSLFIKKDGKYLTPPLSDGLLPGVLREKMLESGEAIEHVLTADDLKTADIYIGNALRGLMKAELIIQTPL